MDNFQAPYLSKSITEFWRRWHISLSTWFKDYLYIPLGGNRRGSLRKHFNVLVVFLVSGLWHGANWTFVLWGLIHGFFNILEDSLKTFTKQFRNNFIYRNLRRLITFIIAIISFVIFRSNNIGQAGEFLLGILRRQGSTIDIDKALYLKDAGVLLCALAVLLFVDIFTYNKIKLVDIIEKQALYIRWLIYLALIVVTVIFGVYGPGYSEIQFIYFQF